LNLKFELKTKLNHFRQSKAQKNDLIGQIEDQKTDYLFQYNTEI